MSSQEVSSNQKGSSILTPLATLEFTRKNARQSCIRVAATVLGDSGNVLACDCGSRRGYYQRGEQRAN